MGSSFLQGYVGSPLPGVECKIMDERTYEEVPEGEPGELWVRGPSVFSESVPIRNLPSFCCVFFSIFVSLCVWVMARGVHMGGQRGLPHIATSSAIHS